MVIIVMSTVLGGSWPTVLMEQFSIHTGMLSELCMKHSNWGEAYNLQKGEMRSAAFLISF